MFSKKLAGGVAVLYVGAATEVEMKERKTVDDALAATVQQLKKVIVPGGVVHVELLHLLDKSKRW